ncbi:MAG: ABC transporter permease [Cyclobacteriaceae bacterium]|nr:ABC transporter permease [Cyclobacteriaceae bacterium HetDA_MAG_MS6]
MIKNYILSSWRSLMKKKGFTVINVLGLACGMAPCILIFLYVSYDLSYDKFQDDHVYRMWINRVYPERDVNYPIVPHSFGPQIVEDIPEVIAQGRCFRLFNPTTVQVDDDYYQEDNIIFADSTFLSVVNVPFKYGDPLTALNDANSVVLSVSTAKKLFGDENAIGKTITFFGNSKKVTAIAHDYPANSHFTFDYITALHQLPFFTQPNWVGFSAMTYLKLQEGANPDDVEEKFPAFVKNHAEGQIQQRNGISYDEYIQAGNGYNYHLTHIKDIHLYSNLENELKANGNIQYIYIFLIIAGFILAIACINFMNLSTARSIERGKEVGIRKVLGSAKRQLVGQFLTESVMVTLLSAVFALVVSYLVLPAFNELAGRPLSMSYLLVPDVMISMTIVVFLVGILAGLYPAFFISSFAPISILKGKLKGGSAGLRNGLVVVQFVISIALISATIIVYDQMNYMLDKPLGFNKDNVIVVENAGAINPGPNAGFARLETFKNEINRIPKVQSSALTSNMVGDFSVRIPGTDQKESMIMRRMIFDDQFPETLGMELAEGRFFRKEFEDSLSIILNESAVAKLGIQDPIGKKVIEIAAGNDPIEFTIIGVIKDFHFQSLHLDLKPAAYTSMTGPNQFISKLAIRIEGDNPARVVTDIRAKWNDFVPGVPFRSYFLDMDLTKFYDSEKKTGRIFGVFTALAIVIACIGLLGLSAFVINQRIKEIGVRKVLGASVPQIIFLLSTDFLKLIVIAAVIAIPLSYIWMSEWLDGFAYAIGIDWITFAISTTAALTIGMATISYQSVRAALANPVRSLRDE